MDMVESNVFSRVPLAKQEKKIRLPFEQRDVVRLLGTLDRSSLKGCRDYALIPISARHRASALVNARS